jgi:membrane-associated phospholipid phosphatase
VNHASMSVRTQALGRDGSRSWHWPSRAGLRVYSCYFMVIAVLFVVGYGGSNWLAAQRAVHLRLYLPAELAIPFIPAMIGPYLSINLLFALPLFRLQPEELRLLGRQMIVTTMVATAIFLFVPTALGFTRSMEPGGFAPAYQLLYSLDYPYNCVPSLHVAYASQIVFALAARGSHRLRVSLALWLCLIMVSTVLSHQHNLLDLACGLLLAACTRAIVKDGGSHLSARVRPHGVATQTAGSE